MNKQNFERALVIQSRLQELKKIEEWIADTEHDVYMYCGNGNPTPLRLTEKIKHAIFREVVREKGCLEKEFEEL